MKKLLVIILALAMLSSYCVIANAKDVSSNIVGGDIQATAQEEAEYLENLTNEDIARINEKIEAANNAVRQNNTRAATKLSIPGTFTMYQQETSYYCVPACIQSVLKYLTGTTYSQSSIASAIGTTTSGTSAANIVPYLNEKQDFYYARTTNFDQNCMCTYLYYTVGNVGVPGLMSIVNPTGANWHYATNGHRLVINAVYSDHSKLQFADPLGGWESDWPYFYEKSSSIVAPICTEFIW